MLVRNNNAGSRLGFISVLLAMIPLACILIPAASPQGNLTGYLVFYGGVGASVVMALIAGLIGSRRWFIALLAPAITIILLLFSP